VLYDNNALIPSYDVYITAAQIIYNSGSSANTSYKLDGTIAYVNDTGFRLPTTTPSSTNYTWIAYE